VRQHVRFDSIERRDQMYLDGVGEVAPNPKMRGQSSYQRGHSGAMRARL
jgi:hypothetical protein